MYSEDQYLQLSGVQHFQFCPRQWALIHIEMSWADNYLTTAGDIMHKRAHDETLFEKRGNTLIAHGIRVSSSLLGIVGQCDIVEFHKNSDGITLKKYPGLWNVCPVEYKHGKEKIGDEDRLQLCAQAICLEEILLTNVSYGFLYYGQDKQREKVEFTDALKDKLKEVCLQMHIAYSKGITPKAQISKKCNSCSLKEICLPQLCKKRNVTQYIDDELSPEEKND